MSTHLVGLRAQFVVFFDDLSNRNLELHNNHLFDFVFALTRRSGRDRDRIGHGKGERRSFPRAAFDVNFTIH